MLRISCCLIVAASIVPLACDPSAASSDPSAIKIGLLVPFTGQSASVGLNYEHAVLMALDRAGKVSGRNISVITRDTRSDAQVAIAQAQGLVKEGVVCILGPESVEAALTMLGPLQSANVLLVSPVIGSGTAVALEATSPWFRLAPSPLSIADIMAQRLANDAKRNIAVIASADLYDSAFAGELTTYFTAHGGTVGLALQLPEDSSDTSQTAQLFVSSSASQTAVILSDAVSAANFVTASTALSPGLRPAWYLSPLLRAPAFVQNTIPRSLEGAVGLTPKIFQARADFAAAFGEEWGGDTPLDGAFFYYDAAALLAFALQSALLSPQGLSYASLRDAIRRVSVGPGIIYGWQQVGAGVNAVRQGSSAYYSGLVGPLGFDDEGERLNQANEVWSIAGGQIIDNSQ